MAEKFSPYDSADYLDSLEDIAYYLEAALEEAGDDPVFIGCASTGRSSDSTLMRMVRRPRRTDADSVGTVIDPRVEDQARGAERCMADANATQNGP